MFVSCCDTWLYLLPFACCYISRSGLSFGFLAHGISTGPDGMGFAGCSLQSTLPTHLLVTHAV
jgi:hypothetical protein